MFTEGTVATCFLKELLEQAYYSDSWNRLIERYTGTGLLTELLEQAY
jgi:hypothetical protein